jgi:hypothetical protein
LCRVFEGCFCFGARRINVAVWPSAVALEPRQQIFGRSDQITAAFPIVSTSINPDGAMPAARTLILRVSQPVNAPFAFGESKKSILNI